jgi:dienelactone hydrolase
MKQRVRFASGVTTLALAAFLATAAQAGLQEEQIEVPVEVTDAYSKVLRQFIKVTVFSDPANPTPAPVLVLNHGRAPEVQQRAALGRARYTQVSRYFVQQGFIVAVPTRMGYGVTSGDDVEDTGICSKKNYPPGYAAAARQTLAVLDVVRQRSDADKELALIVGQSYGGTTAVTVAALNPPGVKAAINFAGGGGGNPKTQPQQPCAPQQLERMFRVYGKTAKVPMLWIYAENDMYFGAKLPKEWFDAYAGEGAPAQFVQFPPHGEDGHSLFTRFPDVWKPKVAQFLEMQGFKLPSVKEH